MAAVTVAGLRNSGGVPLGWTAGEADRGGASVNGVKLQAFDVTVTTSGDTWATGLPIIKWAAWLADATDDPIAITHSAGTLTFTGTNGSTGKVIIAT
jgi:hypothetical protein